LNFVIANEVKQSPAQKELDCHTEKMHNLPLIVFARRAHFLFARRGNRLAKYEIASLERCSQ